MSSPPPPSRRNSSSPRRSNSGSSHTQSQPQVPPRRRPLHERSESEKNTVYRQTPFPTLPSHIFSPKHEPLNSEEARSRSNFRYPTIPPKSPKRLLSPSPSYRSISSSVENGSGENIPPGSSTPSISANTSTIEPLNTSDPHGTGQPQLRRRASAARSMGAVSEPSSTARNREDLELKQQQQPVKLPQSEAQASPDSFVARTLAHQQFPNDETSIPRHKGVERLRSQSSVASRPKPRRTQTAQPQSPRESGDRPRSSSSPNSPTDAFIQALIKSGTNIQYPSLRQPSATSLRSDSSPSLRAAYPPPLRLQRKRANSQLAKAAGVVTAPDASPRSDNYGSSSFRESSLRLMPSQSSFGTYDSEEVIHEVPESPYLRMSPNWVEETGDTVAELNPQQRRAQKSGHNYPLLHPSEQGSRESMRSSMGSFYHFLNDSRTAWAREYYRGEGRIRLETPPSVESVTPRIGYSTPLYSSYYDRDPCGTFSATPSIAPSGPTNSPGSAGFPDRIYIPRIRPLARNEPSVTESGPATTETTDDDMHISVISPSPSFAVSYHDHETLASPVFNPTPAVPYLSPSKREGPGLPYWRASSYDESLGVFQHSNLQLLLFCLGFLMPPVWWVAAFLPLPPQPESRGVSHIDPEYKEHSYGLFDSIETQRYRAASGWRRVNRYMAVAGALIIAAVIACTVVATA